MPDELCLPSDSVYVLLVVRSIQPRLLAALVSSASIKVQRHFVAACVVSDIYFSRKKVTVTWLGYTLVSCDDSIVCSVSSSVFIAGGVHKVGLAGAEIEDITNI